MRVLIIEDERPASQKLVRLIQGIDSDIEIVDILESVERATNWLLSHKHPELIFMDIQLNDGICFEIFENCDIKIPVIFTTAYNEYTLKAFKVNSVDYLLKPINSDELKNAINKFENVHKTIDFSKIEPIINQFTQKNKERFLIKIGNHFKSIQISNINCFFIKERCNFINVGKGQNYAIDYSLDNVEQLIDSKMFFRINRNMIVNFSAIQDIIAYSSNRLKIVIINWAEKDLVLVSRERVVDFKKWMDR